MERQWALQILKCYRDVNFTVGGVRERITTAIKVLHTRFALNVRSFFQNFAYCCQGRNSACSLGTHYVCLCILKKWHKRVENTGLPRYIGLRGIGRNLRNQNHFIFWIITYASILP